jgi:hypothetical protein
MARNKTLGTLLFDLRAECEMATDAGVGQSANPGLKVLLRRTQEVLYDEHDWPHLDGVWFNVTLNAGQRYYDFPSGLNYERAAKAAVKWAGTWMPLSFGFGPDQYNDYDSDADERSDPALRWRIYSGTQFEVWPMPATSTTMRIIGSQSLGSFDQDTDVCVLDGTMVVLFAAAEKMAGKPRGKVLATMAQRRLDQMKARSSNAADSFRPGSAREERGPREIVVRVAS